MEVGIEDCLHIEFEYDRDRYHLKDVVVGKIYFLLVRSDLHHVRSYQLGFRGGCGQGVGTVLMLVLGTAPSVVGEWVDEGWGCWGCRVRGRCVVGIQGQGSQGGSAQACDRDQS